MCAKDVPWLLENIVLEDYPDLQFSTRCWHLERHWFDNLPGNRKKIQMVVSKKKLKKELLQWPSRAVLECQKARVYYPIELERRQVPPGLRRFQKGIWGWGKGRFFGGFHKQSVAGEAGQKVLQALWRGCRAKRKWLSQCAITAAVVGPSLIARLWQRTREAGWPQPLAQAGAASPSPKSWIPGHSTANSA